MPAETRGAARMDWGVALRKTHEQDAGSNRFNFLATFSY